MGKQLNLSQKTGIQFSLSFLIQILGTVVLAVWGYSQLDARISSVHNYSIINCVDGNLSSIRWTGRL
jgi:hypothetical protein